MRSKLLLTLLIVVACLMGRAETVEFTVASLNVDGMPPSLLSGLVKLNPDAKEGAGATSIGNGIASRDPLWDFVALSEDFNYHDDLMAPISQFYNAGTHRGKLYNKIDVLTSPFKTDGLGFLWRKNFKATGESWTRWNTTYGKTSNGSDQLIAKGYRYYMVELAPGLEVDVYIHHMDAETSQKDNEARESQIKQLVQYIKGTNNKRPIIIMGDTNCRYTRDKLKELLIDEINKDLRFEIKDPWVEMHWGGDYGNDKSSALFLGNNAIMTSDPMYGDQKGEVVDKIFFINNAESEVTLECIDFKSETTFTFNGQVGGVPLSDHFPIVATFRATMPDVRQGTDYFIRNKATGKFINQGGILGYEGIQADYGHRIQVEKTATEGEYKLKSTIGSATDKRYLFVDWRPYVFMDNGEGHIFQFENAETLQEQGNNITHKYVKVFDKSTSSYLKADPTSEHVTVTASAADNYCLWELLTIDQLKNELMEKASQDNPMDATFALRCANFSRDDSEISAWTWKRESEFVNNWAVGGENHNFNAEVYHDTKSGIKTGWNTAWSLSQNLTNLPNGRYKVQCQGFYRDGDVNGTTNHAFFKVNDQSRGFKLIWEDGQNAQLFNNDSWQSDLKTNAGKWVPNSQSGVTTYFDLNLYVMELEVIVTDGKIDIVLQKDKSTDTGSWTCFDNFRLTYYGPTQEMLQARDRVKQAIDHSKELKENLDPNGQGSFSIALIEDAWRNGNIVGDGSSEVKSIYESLARATKSQSTRGSIMTYAINNWSFEMGWMNDDRHLAYWASKWTDNAEGKNFGVKENSNATYHSENADGDYVFYAWSGTSSEQAAVTQDIDELPAGVYKIKAWVSSEAGNRLFVFGNGVYTQNAVYAEGKGKLIPVEVEVIVRNGKLTLGAGAVASSTNPNLPADAGQAWNDNYVKHNLAHYTADNFELIYVCNLSFEILQKAINDVKAKAQANGLSVDLSKWQKLVDERNVSDNARQEVLEVYQALGAAQMASASTDKTFAIVNNSFEMGKDYEGFELLGWDVMSTAGDTDVKPNSNSTYTMEGCMGDYLFNAWQDGRGTVISQTIPNPAPGHYTVSAIAANDPNKYVYFEVSGGADIPNQRSGAIKLGDALGKGKLVDFQFEVGEGTEAITIYFGGCNADGSRDDFGGEWYKVDHFLLERSGAEDKCFFYSRLKAAIDEADSIANTLPEKYAKQWSAKKYLDIYTKHIATTPHSDQHLGSGIDEINEIYDRLRTLIFSQTETTANMTGAIKNHSFELGDLTGWTCDATPNSDAKVTDGVQTGVVEEEKDVYYTKGTHIKYLFNCYNKSGESGFPVYQEIKGVPAGIYKLSALVASDPNGQYVLGASYNGTELRSDVITIEKAKNQFTPYEFTFEVIPAAGQTTADVTIGLYPTITNHWYKVDDFELELVGRKLNIDWTMDTPTHGTIMLPFDVAADKLAEEKIEVYSISESHHTPTEGDPEVNSHHILEFKPEDYIKANTPYVVKNLAAASGSKRKAEGAEAANRTIQFSGLTTNRCDTTEVGLLIGTLVSRPAALHEHHLVEYADNVGFVHHALGENTAVAHDSIDAYHAFIFHPIEEYNEIVTGFYFYEPSQTIEWTMETPEYGTLILPFDAALPEEFDEDHEDLHVYEVTGISGERCVVKEGEEFPERSQWYRVMETEEVLSIKAKQPYIVVRGVIPSAGANAPRKARRKTNTEDAVPHTQNFDGVFDNKGVPFTSKELKVDTTTVAILTGLLKSSTAETDSHSKAMTLDKNTGESAFTTVADNSDLPSYHVYLTSANDDIPVVLTNRTTNSDEVVGIEDVMSGEAGNVDVYDLQGVLLRSDIPVGEALDGLSHGIYIIACGEVTIKILK